MKKLNIKHVWSIVFSVVLIIISICYINNKDLIILKITHTVKHKASSNYYDIGPKLVETNYETDDTVIADYIISSKFSDGKTDATTAIQNALKKCESAGGGTVYLPEGKYLISNTINVPTLCTLRGDYQDPDTLKDNETLKYGTIIIVNTNKVPQNINGLFTLNSSSGVVGLTIYYKGQTLNNIIDNNQSWTFHYADQGSLFTIKNITIINGYKGIGKNFTSTPETQSHDMLMIENVKGTLIDTGVLLHNSSDVGIVDGLTLTPYYWVNANMEILEENSTAPTYNEIIKLTRSTNINTAGMFITDIEQQQMSNIIIEGFKYGIYFPSESYVRRRAIGSGSIYNLNIFNTQYGIYVEMHNNDFSPMVDFRWGFNISNSYISGSDYSIMNKSKAVNVFFLVSNNYQLIDDNSNILEKTSDNSEMYATFKLYDVTLDGKTYGKVLYNNSLTTGDFKYTVDDDKTQKVTKNSVLNKYETKTDKKTYGKYFKALDSTSTAKEINAALKEAGNNGGGVVYLKAGLYNISEALYVPTNVELRGASSVSTKVAGVSKNPNHEDGTPLGTVINVVGNTSAVVLDGDNAGVSGIYFIYEEIIKTLGHVQNRKCEVNKCYYECNNNEAVYGKNDVCAYAHGKEINFNELNTNATIISGNKNHVYVSNVTIAGAIYGIGFTNNDNFVISNLVTSVLNNGIIINGGKNGIIKNCLQNGMVIQVNGLFKFFGGSKEYPDAKLINIFNITTSRYENINLNNAKNLIVKNCFTYGAHVFMAASNNSSFIAINTGADTLSESKMKNNYPMYWFDSSGVTATIVNALRFNGAFYNNDSVGNINNVKFLNVSYLNEYFTLERTGEDVPYYLVGGINQKNIISKSNIYNINDYDINNTEISGVNDKTYTGKEIIQNISIKNGNTYLQNNVDYKISYINNKNAGVATMIIYGIGKYKGIRSIDFMINKVSNTVTIDEILKNLNVNKEKKIITKVNFGETVTSFLSKINSSNATVYNKNKILKDNNSKLATGDILKIKLNDEIYEYKISVLGDVTGEGNVNIADVAKLYTHVRGNKLITDESQKEAGNLVNDNKLLINDVARLYNNVRSMQ